MASTTPAANDETIFDQLCGAIGRTQGVTDASLKTAHVLAWNVGPNALVGLEAGGERVVFRIDGEETFAAAFPFDETDVHDDDAELLGRGPGVEDALQSVEYEWLHPEYRGAV